MATLNSSYLEKTGDSLSFQSAAYLHERIASLDLTVPPRNRGRKSFHRERYCLIKYLLALSQTDVLKWPATVVKFERPDFLLVDNSSRLIGIEQTDFGSRDNQEQLSMLQSGKIPSTPPFLDNGPNSGQVGEPKDEEPFARYALAALLRKTRLISRKPYASCNEMRLLLYPNTGLENVDIPNASNILLERWHNNIRRYGLRQPFSSTAIIYGSNEVWLDFAQEARTPQRHITAQTTTLPLL
jgi:hypothetical protein